MNEFKYLPYFRIDNLANKHLANAKLFSNFCLGYIVLFVKPDNLVNFFSSKFGRWISLSGHRASTGPAFLVHVSNIIELCSKKKMIRVYTGWVIANMKHLHSLWNGPIINLPRHSMGTQFALSPLSTWSNSIFNHKLSISAPNLGASPQPASMGLLNLVPKSSFIHIFKMANDGPQVKGGF